jgi:hypothetical protein
MSGYWGEYASKSKPKLRLSGQQQKIVILVKGQINVPSLPPEFV